MAEATFPYGYAKDEHGVQGMGTMLTIPQLEAKQTVYKLHPEFWRRYKALIIAAQKAGVHLGVGTGWRIQPDPPPKGFAPPGNSNHEGFPADGKTGGAVAIDTVVGPNWGWMEKNLKAYGLRSFLQPSTTGYKGTNEPWHIQPAEIPAGRMHRTQPWKLNTFALPNEPPPPTTPTQPPPPSTNWAVPLCNSLPVLKKGASGTPVKRTQHFLCIAGQMSATNPANFDGMFGSGTESALNKFLASGGRPQNGTVDSYVWRWFMDADNGVTTLKKGMKETDVLRMQRMLAANGFMDVNNQANFDGVFGSGTEGALKKFQSSKGLTADGICGARSWTALLRT